MTNKIDVDWSVSPKGATMLIAADKEVRWASKEGQWVYTGSKNSEDGWEFITGNPAKLNCWKTIATRPTKRKTVHDAVEYYDGVWPSLIGDVLCFDIKEGWEYWRSSWGNCHDYYQVCTREEFEKAVAEKKESEKVEWSCHTNVPISFTDRNGDVYELNDCCGDRAEYYKTKTTITKAEAWDIISNSAEDEFEVNSKVMEMEEKYRIVSEG